MYIHLVFELLLHLIIQIRFSSSITTRIHMDLLIKNRINCIPYYTFKVMFNRIIIDLFLYLQYLQLYIRFCLYIIRKFSKIQSDQEMKMDHLCTYRSGQANKFACEYNYLPMAYMRLRRGRLLLLISCNLHVGFCVKM